MERTIIKIDEEKCNGCGLCVNGCHEGALQLINGKAVMVSELYCDGLGACIGDCPTEAITMEKREAEAYDETAVMERLVLKGEKVVLAHLKHLKDHQQQDLFEQGIAFLKRNSIHIDLSSIIESKPKNGNSFMQTGSCPGSKNMSFTKPSGEEEKSGDTSSQLRQWPVQLHLLSPSAPYLKDADLLLAADCAAFAMGDFHSRFLKGKRLAIACPKLDSNKEVYVEKLTHMIDHSMINTLTVMIMEVPCCGGLLQLAQLAQERSTRKIPVKLIIVGLQGNVVSEKWL